VAQPHDAFGKGDELMPAYVVGRITIQDSSWGEEYRKRILPLLEKHGGRYIAATNRMETLEGSAPLPSVMVVIEFPSMDAARAWYHDPEYAPLIRLRQGGSTGEIVLVEGL